MMLFNGQHRRSRPINLGNRQQLNREEALKKAETERQQRLEARRRTEAARRLVAAWRTKKARIELQRRLIAAYLTKGSNESTQGGIELDFAFLMPILFELSNDQAAACLRVLVDNQTRFSESLLISFCSIWNYRPVKHDLVELSAQSIENFSPNKTLLPFSLFSALAGLLIQERSLPAPLLTVLQLVISAHPLQVVRELLVNPLLVESFTDEMLSPLIKLEKLPKIDSAINALPLTLRLLKNPQKSFPLVALVIDLVPSGELDFEHQSKLAEFCSHELVETLVRILSPMPLSKLFLKLFELVPDSKSDLLLHLTLSTTPSPMHSLWHAFKQTNVYQSLLSDPKKVYEDEEAWKLLQLAMELYSYWSTIAMDVDMFNPARGFAKDDTSDVATVLRNAVFSILWNDSHIPAKPILFMTLRQLYTKDTRRRFMAENFWLMEKYIDTNFSASARHFDSIYFDTNFGLSNALERILQQAPFFIRFRTRAELFVQFTERDKASNASDGDLYNRDVSEIRREALSEDAERVFAALGPNLRNLRVQLVSNGEPEAGIDGGGLTKEVLMSITDEMFKNPTSTRPLFVTNENHLLFPNPINSTPGRESAEALKYYRFLGQVIAKCLYEGVLLDIEFSRFFLQKWAGDTAVKNSFDDLYYLDPELYSSLVALYNYEGDVRDLGLDFTTTSAGGGPINLKPNGASIEVTNTNRLEYIHAIANYRLNASIASQTRAFLNGMVDLIPLHWLRMFNPHEIQTLISGGSTAVDIDDLERNTIVNGFPENSPTVKNFWKVVREMTPEQQHKLLQFVTSVPKGPLLGFSNLSPKFGIRCATTGPSPFFDFPAYRRDNGQTRDDGRLPTASTCVNLLKLPDYSSIEILRERLLFAIESNAGFDLS